MQRLVHYIMQSRRHAIMAALLCSLIPFMAWLGIVIMCLVTLRKGPKEGLQILLWVALPSVVLGAIGYYHLFLINVVYGCLLSWALAALLRSTQSWTIVIEVIALVGVVAIAFIHAFYPDIYQYWMQYLVNHSQHAAKVFNLSVEPAAMQNVAHVFAPFATGLQALFIAISALLNVLLARYFQSSVYNKGGFKKELYNVRVDWTMVIIFAAVGISVLLGNYTAIDTLPIIVLPLCLAGLSLMHRLMAQREAVKIWLIAMYAVLIIYPRYALTVLILAALFDTLFNIRKKVIS